MVRVAGADRNEGVEASEAGLVLLDRWYSVWYILRPPVGMAYLILTAEPEVARLT